MGYGTKQEKEVPQLQVSRHHVQAFRRTIPLAAKLLQGTQNYAHQVD
jgi:hypothetical protein